MRLNLPQFRSLESIEQPKTRKVGRLAVLVSALALAACGGAKDDTQNPNRAMVSGPAASGGIMDPGFDSVIMDDETSVAATLAAELTAGNDALKARQVVTQVAETEKTEAVPVSAPLYTGTTVIARSPRLNSVWRASEKNLANANRVDAKNCIATATADLRTKYAQVGGNIDIIFPGATVETTLGQNSCEITFTPASGGQAITGYGETTTRVMAPNEPSATTLASREHLETWLNQ